MIFFTRWKKNEKKKKKKKISRCNFFVSFCHPKACDEIKKKSALSIYRAFESTFGGSLSLSLFDIALSFLLSKEESLHI